MEQNTIYRSPVVCYEISYSNKAYHIDVYVEGFKNSPLDTLHCSLKNFSTDAQSAHRFAKLMSQSAAMPIHIPELAEEFLSA